MSIALLAKTPPAYAACCPCISCAIPVTDCSLATCACTSFSETGSELDAETTIGHIFNEFLNHQEWLITTVFQDHVLSSMMLMADQISTVALQQMQIIGTFFDAKHQLESQRLLQELQAQAHKDYQPSAGMCRFGTNIRSLASADTRAKVNHFGMAARNTQRILMTRGAIGTGSARDDSRSRLAQFRTTYCNPKDFGNSLDLLCEGGEIARRNKDINYTYSIQDEETINMNFANDGLTESEKDVLALSANLYGNRLLPKIPNLHMADPDGHVVDEGAVVYMKTRALAAKRSVAFNSFAAVASKRVKAGAEVLPYMQEILENMGMPAGVINRILKNRPSYNAQMEILTKKLYQHPNFYSDLYDKPVNVDRKDVAMQAIALMQKRDIYRSQLRSEANMAIWLETLVEDLQEYHANEALSLKERDNKILFNLGL